MVTITIPERRLKALVKESVKEALAGELMNLRALVLPNVSKKEQKDVERRYGKPSRSVAKSIRVEL